MRSNLTRAAIAAMLVFPAALAAQVMPTGTSSADKLFASGDFSGAAAAYEGILRTRPSDLDANRSAATTALYRNDIAAASAYAQAALASNPDDTGAKHVMTEIARRRDAEGTYQIEHSDSDVALPLLPRMPLPAIAVTINGHTARLVVDTGAPGLALSAKFAAAAGIATTAAVSGMFLGGKTAPMRTGGHVDTFTAGTLTIHNIPAEVGPVLGDTDGVLGTTFLSHFLATIDYIHQRLMLRPKSQSAECEAAAAAAGDSRVAMYLVPDHFLFARARVNGAPDALFSIDTGGAGIGINLTRASLAAAHIVPDRAHAFRAMGGGGATLAIPFVARTVTIGETSVGAVPGVYLPEGDLFGAFPFTIAGAISQEVFRGTALTFDFTAMRMIISRPPSRTSP